MAGREFILVGTAHISRESADDARAVVASSRPDCVCLELDPRRHAALTSERRFESLDITAVIRERQLSTLVLNLVLAFQQRRLGNQLGVLPGTEFVEAARAARDSGIPVVLCDRDVRVTLRRAWSALGLRERIRLIAALLGAVVEPPQLTEAMLRDIRERDAGTQLIEELSRSFPAIKTVLIDERDAYLTQQMLRAPGRRIVAVVGAGHVAGIARGLREQRGADLDALDAIPPAAPVWKALGWGIPAAIVAAIAAIAWRHGAAAAGDSILFWVLANGVPSGLGAACAGAHPLAVLTAFAAAPFTSLTPLIGAGYVAAFAQAYLRPPLVGEFATLIDDAGSVGRWWTSRLLRILLVFLLSSLGSALGTWVGAARIVSDLF